MHRFEVNFRQQAPNPSPAWPIGANLGSSWVQDSATWGQVGPLWGHWAQPGPILQIQCDTLNTCVFTAISTVWGFMQGHVAQLRRPTVCPHTGPSYTSKRAQVAPCWASWAQVGANWPEFGASYAQDGPKWAPVRPTLRPRAAPVGLWLGQVDPLLSSLCSLGAGGSRREATWIMKVQHWNKTLQNKICRSP